MILISIYIISFYLPRTKLFESKKIIFTLSRKVKKFEGGAIRTPDLRIWNPMRYRCATPPVWFFFSNFSLNSPTHSFLPLFTLLLYHPLPIDHKQNLRPQCTSFPNHTTKQFIHIIIYFKSSLDKNSITFWSSIRFTFSPFFARMLSI